MTIQQLEYLIAVDKHRHFGQAAAACFVTQPTLSAQLSKLEKELGVILFDRSKMPVIPTESGVQVIAQAKKVLSESKGIFGCLWGAEIGNPTYPGPVPIALIYPKVFGEVSAGQAGGAGDGD